MGSATYGFSSNKTYNPPMKYYKIYGKPQLAIPLLYISI